MRPKRRGDRKTQGLGRGRIQLAAAAVDPASLAQGVGHHYIIDRVILQLHDPAAWPRLRRQALPGHGPKRAQQTIALNIADPSATQAANDELGRCRGGRRYKCKRLQVGIVLEAKLLIGEILHSLLIRANANDADVATLRITSVTQAAGRRQQIQGRCRDRRCRFTWIEGDIGDHCVLDSGNQLQLITGGIKRLI